MDELYSDEWFADDWFTTGDVVDVPYAMEPTQISGTSSTLWDGISGAASTIFGAYTDYKASSSQRDIAEMQAETALEAARRGKVVAYVPRQNTQSAATEKSPATRTFPSTIAAQLAGQGISVTALLLLGGLFLLLKGD